jgi:hypothetical protein
VVGHFAMVVVPFEIHSATPVPRRCVDWFMARRNLRIVKRTPTFVGVCERCSSKFNAESNDWEKGGAEIRAAFDVHPCVSRDRSQKAPLPPKVPVGG